MKLNYEFLKENVVEVEVLKEFNMGPIEDFLDQTNGVMINGLKINDNNEAIIIKGAKGKFNVQPFNGWYEMTIDGYSFDVALENEELNEFIKGLKIIGPNKHFIKEA